MIPVSVNPDNISIVLNRPRYPENIGAAARAIRNMGIDRLLVVNPENFDLDRVRKLATRSAADLVGRIEIHESLGKALSEHNFVVGTTARLGGQRQVVLTPSKLAGDLVPISRENRIAVVFGPEDRGLSNEDLRYCHVLVNIPTAEFSSLNLAQAVMIMCYEIYLAKADKKAPFVPRLANRYELDGMYEQVKEILVKISYINNENPDYWMNHLRHFLTRMRLRAREVSMIRGICRQIDWYCGKRYRDGLSEGKDNETG